MTGPGAPDKGGGAGRGGGHSFVMSLAFAALALLILSLTVFKMSNNDIWIHLKTGQIILETWSVPTLDPYSFTASDHDYVAHEWLSGVLFYLVYAAGGVNGLIYFKSIVIFATCAALWGAGRFLRIRPGVLLPCMTVMLFIGSARFLERPHIFSYLFVALYLLCYFGWREGGRNRRWLYAIPLLHILWTNLHGGHYQGIFLLVMLAAAEVVMFLRSRLLGLASGDASSSSEVGFVCALPFVSLAAGLVNPYGYRLLTFPFELTGQEIFMRGIYEWQPAFYPSYNLSSMFLYYVVWTIVLFGSFLAVRGNVELKTGWREAAWAGNAILALLWVVLAFELADVYHSDFAEQPTALQRQGFFWYGAVALFLAANFHRLQFEHAGIVALFFALSMRHNRSVTDAAIATMPTLAYNLDAIVSRLSERYRRTTRDRASSVSVVVAAAVMGGLALFTFQNSYYFGFHPPTTREMGLGIASNMPTGAVDYVERNRITGRCFPSYNAAAMLINRMWPDVKVAMDSRNDVYGETLYREYTQALSGGPALEEYVRKWEIDFFLITYGSDRAPQFFQYLDSSPEWRLVYFDDRSVVYLRNLPRFAEILRRDSYDLINPARTGSVEIRQEDALRWLAEAERGVAAAPTAWTPLQYKAKALIVMNRLDEAEAIVRRILAILPDAWFAWSDLGFVHLLRGDNDQAAFAFSQCLRYNPGSRLCRQYLDRSQGRS